jgi:SpoVK/Ycf46/Vps4 family AAA+-type ATPase
MPEGRRNVSNRVFAQIAQFMGNTELRGEVIWFLLTCRPDLLPVDLKRQGRAEEHIALFYPDTDDERLALLRAMQRKTRTPCVSSETDRRRDPHRRAFVAAGATFTCGS